MSDNVTTFVPANPTDKVSDEYLPAIEEFLTQHYAGSTEIRINRAYEKPFFIDAGSDHESITCPTCGGDVPIPEWQAAMNACWVEKSQGYDLIPFAFSCCGTTHSPDQLQYVPHQAFALASFEVTNPSSTDHDTTLNFLMDLLSIQFSVVNARY